MLLSVSLLIWTSCSDYAVDDEINAMLSAKNSVEVDLAYSVSHNSSSRTRMAESTVQESGDYRNLQDVHVIPFEVRGKITVDDLAKRERITSMDEGFDHTAADSWFYYSEHCEFMSGVASFLVYGRAIPTYGTAEPTVADKIANGSLTAVFPANMNPSGISFAPEAIYGTSTPDAKATAIAGYLTAIANTEVTEGNTTYKWGNLSSPAMKALHQNFIGQENVKAMDIAGSSNNVLKYVNELYKLVNGMRATASGTDLNICEKILSNISSYEGVAFSNGEVTSLGDVMSGYPANIGLPDGAAVVRWTGSSFEPQTQTTTMDNINSIAHYAYPAELYYYANSQIKTSTSEGQKPYYTSASTWADVLDEYEYDKSVVSPNTKAVAIIDPLQYGVAQLQIKLKKTDALLQDAAGNVITVGSSNFPLTAIIVGDQHQVGFDFKPCDDDVYLMYDNNVTIGTCLSSSAYQDTGDVSAVTHTLVLQSNNDEEISLVLEFTNNSDQTIVGVDDGQIYPGTKFYLVGKLDPSYGTLEAGIPEDVKKRVFTQDRITKMTMKVESFAKAYNVVPNLLSPRLEVGVQVITDWMLAEPTNVMLE